MIVRTIAAGQLAGIDWTAPGKHVYAIDFGEGPAPLLGVVNAPAAGRTLLLTGGVHGDEYDGPVVLTDLLDSIDPATVHGRLIVMPVANPGGLALRQRHMTDGSDLNRSFPGRADGSLSERTAYALNEVIIPLADIVYDLHSGGIDHAIMPSVIVNRRATIAEADAAIDAALAFGAPVVIVMLQDGHAKMMDGAAELQGKVFGCAEIGSLGAITPTSLAIARNGVARLMAHCGLQAAPSDGLRRRPETKLLAAMVSDCMLRAEEDGVFVPALHLGDGVGRDGLVGRLLHLDDATRKPMTIRSKLAGEVYVIHAGGPLRRGDAIATIAQPVDESALRALTRPEEVLSFTPSGPRRA